MPCSWCCFIRRENSRFDSHTKTKSTVCKECLKPLSIFKRQKCADCMEMHCSQCLQGVIVSSGGVADSTSPPPCYRLLCRKCNLLASRQYTSSDLMSYTVRELRQYLARRDITECNCTEKSDLVELILCMDDSQSSHRRAAADEEDEHRRHVEILRLAQERMRNEVIEGIVVTASIVSAERVDSDIREKPAVDNTSPTEPLVHQPVVIDSEPTKDTEIEKRRDYIGEMSIEQLQEMLMQHGIEYPNGCADKAELLAKVCQLQIVSPASAISSDSSQKSGLKQRMCCVCTYAIVDCVLLDCGHMVTCTACAQQLHECPVCHQFIARTVHVYRA